MTPAPQDTFDELDELVLAYLDGELDATEFAAFCDKMREDPAALDRFIELALLDRAMLDTLEQREQVRAFDRANHQRNAPSLSFNESLELLDHGSESARLIHLATLDTPRQPIKPYLIGAAIAAAIMLTATLALVLLSGNPKPQPIAQHQSPSVYADIPTAPEAIPVATLTATHNAVWDSQPAGDLRRGAPLDLRRGDALYPNQQLTLTQGFAEITTARGAIAILQAPVKVELIDDENALRLLSGAIVGICESQSSKGFVVHTPYADITDLGTEFGVIAGNAGTTVNVMQGQVRIDPSLQNSPPLVLEKNNPVRADDQGIQPLRDKAQVDLLFAALRSQSRFRHLNAAGQIRLLPKAPESLAYGQSIDFKNMQLFCEKQGVVLDEGLSIDVTDTGRFNSNDYEPGAVTLAGQTVDSYMLFASRTSDKPSWEAEITRLKLSLTFDRPIVGLIGLARSLNASDASLGLDELPYEQQINRGLLMEKNALVQDFIEISEDRKTLTIDCKVVGVDQLRILVQSQ